MKSSAEPVSIGIDFGTSNTVVALAGPDGRAEARNSIGIVLVGGMAIGTIFTLFVVPMFYTFIAKETARPEPANDLAAPHGPPAEPHKPLLAAE